MAQQQNGALERDKPNKRVVHRHGCAPAAGPGAGAIGGGLDRKEGAT